MQMQTRAVPRRLRQPAFWAAAAPLLCAVHCAAAPLAVLALPAFAASESVERGFMGVSALLAAAFLASGIRQHGRWIVAAPVAAGAALWLAAELPGSPLPHSLTNAFGGLLLASGMLWNATLRHRAACRGCGCPAHAHGD